MMNMFDLYSLLLQFCTIADLMTISVVVLNMQICVLTFQKKIMFIFYLDYSFNNCKSVSLSQYTCCNYMLKHIQ